MTDVSLRMHRAAAWFADRVAASDGDRSLTFAELEERCNRLAHVLLRRGARSGGRVAILLPNSLEWLEADFGVLKAGKAKVPINTRLTPDEREYLLADSRAETVITDADGLASLTTAVSRLPELQAILVVGRHSEAALGYEEELAAAPAEPPNVAPDPGSPSVILYTSGTTGRPKGAVASFESRWLTTCAMLTDELIIEPGDAMIHAASMAHGGGSKSLAFWLRGARNVIMPRFDGPAFLRLANRVQATHTFVVPTMIASLVEAAGDDPSPAPSMKQVSYGGAPISASLLHKATEVFGPVFVQVYGSCEAPHPLSILTRSDHMELTDAKAASIGRETLGIEFRIVGPDGPVPVGEPGELQVRGPSIMIGYWENPAATREALVDGWYRTGDVAIRDASGYYSIVDRQRDMIITGGLNVYPAEVERAISQLEGVSEVAVIGIPDEKWGEAVTAFIAAEPDAHLTEEIVVDHCRRGLAGYKKPRRVEFREHLPKGPTGKILKRALRDPFWDGAERMVS